MSINYELLIYQYGKCLELNYVLLFMVEVGWGNVFGYSAMRREEGKVKKIT